MKKNREKWPFERKVETFLLIFGVLVIVVPMIIAMTATEFAFTPGEAMGIIIAGGMICEAGLIMTTVRRHKAGKDISFLIGACIGVVLMTVFQILG